MRTRGGKCRYVLGTCWSTRIVSSDSCDDEGQIGCRASVHRAICPLDFLDDIQAGVDDELVYVSAVIWEAEARNAISAGLRGPKLLAKKRDVHRGQNCKVI